MQSLPETFPIASKLLIQPFGRDAVDLRQIDVQDDARSANFADQIVNFLILEGKFFGRHAGETPILSGDDRIS